MSNGRPTLKPTPAQASAFELTEADRAASPAAVLVVVMQLGRAALPSQCTALVQFRARGAVRAALAGLLREAIERDRFRLAALARFPGP